jgi:lipid-binding SYLF domain-containing protein
MKKLSVLILAAAVGLGVGCSQQHNSASSGGVAASSGIQGDKAEAVDRLNDASKVLTELTNAPDAGIPAAVLEKAHCVAVVPSLVKGGIIAVGAQHGRGVATCRNNGSWSAPAFFTMSGGSWGPQIGVQSTDLVLLFMTDDGAKKLINSNFKIGADASIAAGPYGRDAQAATDWKADTGILSYSRTKGLFAGLDLSGAAINEDKDSTMAFYGKPDVYATALNGQVQVPQLAQTFIAQVRKDFREANGVVTK